MIVPRVMIAIHLSGIFRVTSDHYGEVDHEMLNCEPCENSLAFKV